MPSFSVILLFNSLLHFFLPFFDFVITSSLSSFTLFSFLNSHLAFVCSYQWEVRNSVSEKHSAKNKKDKKILWQVFQIQAILYCTDVNNWWGVLSCIPMSCSHILLLSMPQPDINGHHFLNVSFFYQLQTWIDSLKNKLLSSNGCGSYWWFASRHQMKSSRSFLQNTFIFFPFHSFHSIPFYLEVNYNLLCCNLDIFAVCCYHFCGWYWCIYCSKLTSRYILTSLPSISMLQNQ